MATATPTRTLADALRERWEASDKTSGSHYDDDVEQPVHAFRENVLRYWQYDDGPDQEAETPVAPAWLAALEAELVSAGKQAWEDHVLPELIAVVERYLPTAPRYLVEFPKSEALREDLATLEAGR